MCGRSQREGDSGWLLFIDFFEGMEWKIERGGRFD
jgi:hypothetical protein